MPRWLFPLALVVLLGAALVWVVWFWPGNVPVSHARLDPVSVPQGGDFILDSDEGPLSLADLRGQVVLVYFGYRLCPDICPTNLAGMARAFEMLKPEEAARVQGIFISLDPERDSLADLAAYTAYFHPRIRGATGTPQAVAALAEQYAVAWRKVPTESALGYMLDHSAQTFLIAPDGRIGALLDHATPPASIVRKIREFL